jgi:hypothetical protein
MTRRIADELRTHREAQARGEVPTAGPPVLVEALHDGEAPLPQLTLGMTAGLATQRIAVDEFKQAAERARVELMAALQDRIADESQIFPIVSKANVDRVTVGRISQSDIAIPDHTVSARHALITLGNRQVLSDLGSANGTFVNGHRLEQNESHSLQSGDCVRFGHRAFYYLKGDRLVLFVQVRLGARPGH